MSNLSAMFIIVAFVAGAIVGWSGALLFSSRIWRIFKAERLGYDEMHERIDERIANGARLTSHRFRP